MSVSQGMKVPEYNSQLKLTIFLILGALESLRRVSHSRPHLALTSFLDWKVPWITRQSLFAMAFKLNRQNISMKPVFVRDKRHDVNIHRILTPLVWAAISDMIYIYGTHVGKGRVGRGQGMSAPAFEWWDCHTALAAGGSIYKSRGSNGIECTGRVHSLSSTARLRFLSGNQNVILLIYCAYKVFSSNTQPQLPTVYCLLLPLLLPPPVACPSIECVCWCLPAVFLFAKLIGNKIPQQLRIIIWDDASRTLRHQSVQAQLQRKGWGRRDWDCGKFHHLKERKRNDGYPSHQK